MKLVKLNLDAPDSRWLIFPTRELKLLWLRHNRHRFNYINTWDDVQGFGLHATNCDFPNNPHYRKAN